MHRQPQSWIAIFSLPDRHHLSGDLAFQNPFASPFWIATILDLQTERHPGSPKMIVILDLQTERHPGSPKIIVILDRQKDCLPGSPKRLSFWIAKRRFSLSVIRGSNPSQACLGTKS
jgi:hypothetical protein